MWLLQGDILHLVRRNVSKSELEVRKNASPDIIRLPVDYIGPFREVVDTNQLYTLGLLRLPWGPGGLSF